MQFLVSNANFDLYVGAMLNENPEFSLMSVINRSHDPSINKYIP